MLDAIRSLALEAAVAALIFVGGPIGIRAAEAAERPVQAEHNPPGDIPDTQIFITYQGPGFTLKVPEGWARKDEPAGAVFSDKYNVMHVSAAATDTAPTVASVNAGDVKQLEAIDRAVKVIDVKAVSLDGGKAVRINYQINSAPNAVTNKQIRLEDVRYLIFNNSKLVTLDMAAPLGADNADQWQLMSNSVRIP